jgi:hypothetical protein
VEQAIEVGRNDKDGTRHGFGNPCPKAGERYRDTNACWEWTLGFIDGEANFDNPMRGFGSSMFASVRPQGFTARCGDPLFDSECVFEEEVKVRRAGPDVFTTSWRIRMGRPLQGTPGSR